MDRKENRFAEASDGQIPSNHTMTSNDVFSSLAAKSAS